MPANSFTAIRPVGANHASEFIRRYSPCRGDCASAPATNRDIVTTVGIAG